VGARTETGAHGAGGEEGALPVAVGVLGLGGAASVVPG
jgi:hypothetical protein